MLAPGAAVVDLDTEFGLNVVADGKTDLMVFEGKAEVSVLNAAGHTLQNKLLEGRQAVQVDSGAGPIREVPAQPDQFVAAPELIPPALVPDPAYADAACTSRTAGIIWSPARCRTAWNSTWTAISSASPRPTPARRRPPAA